MAKQLKKMDPYHDAIERRNQQLRENAKKTKQRLDKEEKEGNKKFYGKTGVGHPTTSDGVWRTVRGRHVFIEEGKTLEQALGHKPGVENQKKVEDPNPGPEGRKVMNSNPQHPWNQKKTEEPRDYAKERREKIFKANAKKYKKDFVFRKQK